MNSITTDRAIFPNFEINRWSVKPIFQEGGDLNDEAKCIMFRTYVRKKSEEDDKWYLIPVMEELYKIQYEDECLKRFISSCYSVLLFFKLDSNTLKIYHDLRGYPINILDEFQGDETERLGLNYGKN